ncbi:MAG: 2-hydroxyacyl-CoA dehydratase [Dehalococcoidia bacterium]|nr:2-hydroxyacyl-CoA dehydratase [Dehalococcoidia bacterium]
MNALERCHEVVTGRHAYARQWKERTEGKVVGYFCTYVPEELLLAAGILPVRVLGGHQPSDVTEPYITSRYCPHCRDVLAQGLEGKYDYLDGIVYAHTCVHIGQAFACWERHIPTEYSYFIYMPASVQSPAALPRLAQEVADFRTSLEEWTGKPLSPEHLDRAIQTYNTNRRLLWDLYALRRGEPPLLRGSEALEVVLAGQMMDKEEHNHLLTELLTALPQRPDPPSPGVRLFTGGGENDDVDFLRLAEYLGANVVADDHCTGSRYFWNQVPQDADPLRALARRYLERSPCPQKDWVERRRLPIVRELARDYSVEAAILTQQKFCDPHEYDIPVIKDLLEGMGIPCLFLEFDVTIPAGQFRTRMEAFLEMLTLDMVR